MGNDCSQWGNNAKSAKGSASPKPNPDMPAVNCHAPPSLVNAPASREPKIGPVQENDTIAKVNAIKKTPAKSPMPDLESILLANELGSPIS